METLAERVAVVTGAASGIGAGIARACAEAGMQLVLADIELEPARALAGELGASGTRCLTLQTDVSKPEDCEALAEASFEHFGAADVLFNNAGVAQGGALHEFEPEDWEWLLGVNLYGVVHGCRAFVPRWLERGTEAHIVNTASIGGFLAGPVLGMYCASKYAVVAYSEALAMELAEQRIGVSVLCPGLVKTQLGSASRNRPERLGRPPDQLEILTGAMSTGMEPIEVGRHALRGVREKAAYVFTHPDFGPVIEERFDRIRSALERAREPLAQSR